MKHLIFTLIITGFLCGCNDVGQVLGDNDEKKEVTYSFSCLDSSLGKPINKHLEKAGDLFRNAIVSEKDISDSVQTEYGSVFHKEMIESGEFKLMKDGQAQAKLDLALQQLLAAREKPSGIAYSIYAIDDTLVNAFTFGGRIYITKAMLDKCKNNDALLYAIVGHEIGHSEVGHIRTTIQEMEVSNTIFGEDNGITFFQLKKLLTASFNQKNELEADYYGINLTHKLGYDLCTAVQFWREMSGMENNYNKVEDFFRTHPFSNLRADCLTNHIKTNFGKNCGTISSNTTNPKVVQ